MSLHQIGVDTGGKPVMGGLFELFDTHGFPLSDAITYLKSNGVTPGLHDFLVSAQRHGWPLERAKKYIRQACIDAGIGVPPQV